MRFLSSQPFSLLLVLTALLPQAAWSDEPPTVLTQKPEVAPAQPRGTASQPAAKAPAKLFEGGAAPAWIWGEKPDVKYFLKSKFTGPAKSARLRATCDNRMTVFLNGEKVADSGTWERPVEVDVSKHVKAGENVILAEVANEGGPSGFILKLALTAEDGSTKYVVTSSDWQAGLERDGQTWVAAKTVAKLGEGAWGGVFLQPTASATRVPLETFEVLPGFQVERLFTVPKEQFGSWVAIAFDNKGRLIASDQDDKGLYRITPAVPGSDAPTKVERLKVKMSAAQGLLYAFDSLYVSVNGGAGSGLFRLRDTDNDDQYDEVKKLADFNGGGEHGPHALRLAPDGKSIYVMIGNHSDPMKLQSSRIPTNWQEDLLLPRQWDANGHAVGRLAPGGFVVRTDPEGKAWEMFSIGYRNAYDFDFNADGELFGYDSDMEWDMGSPWYRPTRVNHIVDGSEFGWRSGTGVWPNYYVDSLPPAADIGPGSPVGVSFGYGTKFPAKYQQALYVCDWTYGTMYALHLEPAGASYKAVREEFLSRTPLPLTDVTPGPDGCLYFTVGGRGTQSELYRVRYVGTEPTSAANPHQPANADLRALRRQIEAYHAPAADPAKAVEYLWPFLGHADRHIRYAARVGLEFQKVDQWSGRLLAEKNPETLITGAVALARQGDKSLQPKLLAALNQLEFGGLPEAMQLELLRVWSLVFIRMGEPDVATGAALAKKLDAFYPAKTDYLNRELCTLLVYLKSPTVVAKTIAEMKANRPEQAETLTDLLTRNPGYGGTIAQMQANRPHQQQIHYAFVLRNAKTGWTLEDRKYYFQWFEAARKWSGGASFQGFLRNIDKDAFDNASDTERLAMEALGARKPYQPKELPKAQGPGQAWTLEQLLAAKEKLKGRNFEAGKKAFAAARCIVCHRFNGDGGATGPDLTLAAGRFSYKDICEAIVDPSKVVSDQYLASIVETKGGLVHTGRIVNDTKDKLTVLISPEDSTKVVDVAKSDIEEVLPSKVSLMPGDLLKTLNENEVLDLLAYLLSRGDPQDPAFKK